MKCNDFRIFVIVDIVLENNADLAEKLLKKAIPTKEYFEIPGEDGSSKLEQQHCTDKLSRQLDVYRVSCVVCRVSCVMCRVSCVVCRVSCVVCRVSCDVRSKKSEKLWVEIKYNLK